MTVITMTIPKMETTMEIRKMKMKMKTTMITKIKPKKSEMKNKNENDNDNENQTEEIGNEEQETNEEIGNEEQENDEATKEFENEVQDNNEDEPPALLGRNAHDEEQENDIERRENNTEQEQTMDEKYGARTTRHDLRPQKPRDYGHMHVTIEDAIEAIALTQCSIKRGLKVFGQDGVDAVTSELNQLHIRKVLKPEDADNLTRDEKKGALQHLMFLKQKRCGRIKGRGCADGRKERDHTAKDEATSPTVAIESVLLSCTIDAKERRDVATADTPGAFMQVDMDEDVCMKLEGTTRTWTKSIKTQCLR
jgi:hypothetical protein